MPSVARNLRSDESLAPLAQPTRFPLSYAQDGMFSLLPERRPPWKEFLFSMGTQGVLAVLLAWIAVLHPEILTTAVHTDRFIPLVNTPVPVPQEPAPVRTFRAPVAHLQAPPVRPAPTLAAPKPQIEPPPQEVPGIRIAESKPAPVEPPKPAIPKQLVKTNVFSSGSSAGPTIARAPQQVQTGGFGDPDGVPSRTQDHPVNIAQLGAFDAPSGPGSGNGTGGARGTRGVVASSGFGNGVATGDGTGRANMSRGNGIHSSGFGDMEPAVAPTRSKPAEQAGAIPAEITSKPNPVYTDEARKLHIEGEVLLEVVFESSGQLHVVRVIRGLGHGLDEAAVRAAEQIRFKPALRDGKPADSTAVLHILFQLA